MTDYIYLGDQRVAAITDGAVNYYHADHLGGANVITNSSGVMKELTEYDPYGKYSRQESYGTAEEKAFRYFTGKEYDTESELYYFEARYYDPALGRFITSDTVVQSPGNPQTLNRYAYCGNNPINRIDPSGHSWFTKFLGKLIGTVAAAIGFVVSGGNPAVAFAAFSITDTVVSGTQALLAGASPGRVFGAIGLSIILNSIIPNPSSTLSRGAIIGLSALRGAAISVATTAAISGSKNLGEAAAWGGGMAALGSFLNTANSGTKNESSDKLQAGKEQTNRDSANQDIIQQTNSRKSDPLAVVKGAKIIQQNAENTKQVVIKECNATG